MSWTERLQSTVRGIEFYGPRDAGNPAPGEYTIVGPLSEQRHSRFSMEHAAQLYLAQVCRDKEAGDAFRAAGQRDKGRKA